jgi:hypothetical protein
MKVLFYRTANPKAFNDMEWLVARFTIDWRRNSTIRRGKPPVIFYHGINIDEINGVTRSFAMANCNQ